MSFRVVYKYADGTTVWECSVCGEKFDNEGCSLSYVPEHIHNCTPYSQPENEEGYDGTV